MDYQTTGQREVLRDKLVDDEHQLVNLNALGRSYVARLMFPQGIATFHVALDFARLLRKRDRVKSLTVNLASAYADSGNTGESYKHYTQALSLARQRTDPGQVITPLNGLAGCYRRHGKLVESLEAIDEAVAVARATHSKQLAELLLNAARYYLDRNDYATAEDHLAQADQLIGADRRVLCGRHLDATAEMWLRRGEPGRARTYAERAVYISRWSSASRACSSRRARRWRRHTFGRATWTAPAKRSNSPRAAAIGSPRPGSRPSRSNTCRSAPTSPRSTNTTGTADRAPPDACG